MVKKLNTPRYDSENGHNPKMDFLISYGWLGVASLANKYEPRFKKIHRRKFVGE